MPSRWAGDILNPPQAVFRDWHKLLWLDFEWENAYATPSIFMVINQRAITSPWSFFPLQISTMCVLFFFREASVKVITQEDHGVSLEQKDWGTVLKYTRKWKMENQPTTQYDCETFSQILESRWWQKPSFYISAVQSGPNCITNFIDSYTEKENQHIHVIFSES